MYFGDWVFLELCLLGVVYRGDSVGIGWRLPAPFGVLLSEAECSGNEGGDEDDEDDDDEQTAQADEHDVKGLQATWQKRKTTTIRWWKDNDATLYLKNFKQNKKICLQ